MNKTDKKKVLKAMNKISKKHMVSCFALDANYSDGKSDIVKRYCQFYDRFYPSSSSWFGPWNSEEGRQERLTALALFMVAEKDIIG